MENYRMYLQPKYGEKAPEVRIPDPENFDMSNPTTSRKKLVAEIYAGIVNEVKVTSCYDAICTVPTTDVRVTVMDAQERFHRQVELQILRAYGHAFDPKQFEEEDFED